MIFQTPDHITWKNLESGTVLLDLRSSNYYTLNETATKIWLGITEGKSEHELLVQMLNEYDCDEEECNLDIKEQITYLMKEGFIVEKKEPVEKEINIFKKTKKGALKNEKAK
jgi:hypothetical protein